MEVSTEGGVDTDAWEQEEERTLQQRWPRRIPLLSLALRNLPSFLTKLHVARISASWRSDIWSPAYALDPSLFAQQLACAVRSPVSFRLLRPSRDSSRGKRRGWSHGGGLRRRILDLFLQPPCFLFWRRGRIRRWWRGSCWPPFSLWIAEPRPRLMISPILTRFRVQGLRSHAWCVHMRVCVCVCLTYLKLRSREGTNSTRHWRVWMSVHFWQ